jgi:hypothetical protein
MHMVYLEKPIPDTLLSGISGTGMGYFASVQDISNRYHLVSFGHSRVLYFCPGY